MNITFIFSLDDTNAILTALGQLPYAQSAHLINMIHTQASPQIVAANKEMAVEQVPEVLNG